MNDVGGNFARRTEFGAEEDISLAIEWGAFLEELADAGFGILHLEKGAMDLVGNALVNRFGRTPEADHEGMGLEAGEVFVVADEPAASGDDGAVPGLQFLNHLAFVSAKLRFPFGGKDFGNPLLGDALDHDVGIDELET